MNFGDILQRAWQIIWKHKILWLFGVLASCSAGGGGGGGNFNLGARYDAGERWAPFFNQFERMPDAQIAFLVLIMILVVLVLTVLGIFLGTMGRIGLIRGTYQADQGAERLELGELFNGSLKYFWRVFLLNLLVGLAIAVVFIIATLLLVFGGILTLGVGLICLLPLFCLLIPLTWFVNVILEQANVAIVVDELGIMAALERGWEVVRANLGNILIMALILMLGVGFIGGLIIGLPVAIIVVPAVIGLAAGGNADFANSGLLVAGICFVGYLPVLLLLNGILRGYISSAWTLTYLRLTRPAAEIVS